MKDLSSQSKPPMCPWSKASGSPFIYLRPHGLQALAEMMLISQKAIIEGEDHFLETRKTFSFVSDYNQQLLSRERPEFITHTPLLYFCGNDKNESPKS